MRLTGTITALAALSLGAGCTELRDLYEARGTVLHAVCAWHEALEGPTMDATMLLYGGAETRLVGREFFDRPNGVSARVGEGSYDVVLINGVMESEKETNLDHIYMRGTDTPATFEVCVAEARPSRLISRAEGEYIAAPGMSLFALARGGVEITGADGLRPKYVDGRRVDYDSPDNELHAEYAPRVYNYRFVIRMTEVVNPLSAGSVAGAVRGFAGSVFPCTGDGVPRMGFAATYHLNFPVGNVRSTRVGEEGGQMEIGTLESSTFVTFGPAPTAEGETPPASGRYFFEPVFVLVDRERTEFRLAAPIDITRQVNEIAVAIADHHSPEGTRIKYADNLFVIEIPDAVVLPVVESGNPDPNPGTPIDVDDWGPDEPAVVWI